MKDADRTDYDKTANRMRLAARIADLLVQKGWNQNQLAEAMSKRPSEISKWLSGTHNFTLDTLTEIGLALRVSVGELVSDTASMSPEELLKELGRHLRRGHRSKVTR